MATPETQAAPPKPGKYRYVGWHATEVFKADGTLPWLGPGDYIDLTKDDIAADGNVELLAQLVDASGIPNET